jgi:hypothetical protein
MKNENETVSCPDILQKEENIAGNIYNYWTPSISKSFIVHKSILLYESSMYLSVGPPYLCSDTNLVKEI